MLLTLVTVVAWDLTSLSLKMLVVYVCLVLLAAYTFYRGYKAKKLIEGEAELRSTTYLDDVGFTLISLFDGFVIVSAIDLNAPGWLVGLIGTLGIWIGSQTINHIKKKNNKPFQH